MAVAFALPPCSGPEARVADDDPPTDVLRATLVLGLRGYQRLISPGDGPRCALYPTCSGYAVQAVRRDGPLLGVWLTTARLLRDHHDRHDPLCVAGDRVLRRAPVEEDEW